MHALVLWAQLEVAALRRCCIGVPEPVRVVQGEETARPDLTAFVEPDWRTGGWQITLTTKANRGGVRRLREIVAHELCHTLYPSTVLNWGGLTKKERRAVHRSVDDCAQRVLRAREADLRRQRRGRSTR